MAKFEPAIAFVLENEGSDLYIDNNTGEYSRYGITLKTASALALCKPDDRGFIENLSIETAQGIYRKCWWFPMCLWQVMDQAVATKLLDMAVNMGQTRAVTILQRALNDIGRAPLAVDGRLGPKTLAAINRPDPYELLTELRANSLGFYYDLVEKNPALAKNWKGWKARAER